MCEGRCSGIEYAAREDDAAVAVSLSAHLQAVADLSTTSAA